MTNHTDNTYPWYHTMRLAIYLSNLLPKAHNPSLIIRKIPTGSQTVKYLTTTPQKSQGWAGHWWLTHVIPATQEAAIRRIEVQSQHGQNSSQDSISKKNITKRGWWSGSRYRACVQTPALQKKKKKSRLANGVAQVVEHLPNRLEGLTSNSSAAKKQNKVSRL
jgi:hypothetical protein